MSFSHDHGLNYGHFNSLKMFLNNLKTSTFKIGKLLSNNISQCRKNIYYFGGGWLVPRLEVCG